MIGPQDLGLLHIDNWRVDQLEAVLNSVSSGKRFVGQCAPTGVGKGEILVAEHLINRFHRTLILTSSKSLQDQYNTRFSYLNPVDVRGKRNYSCIATDVGGEFYDSTPVRTVADGPCHFGHTCSLKINGCTYYDRIRLASRARLVHANYAAWIYSNLYTEGWGYFPLILCDEAHEAERWLLEAISIRLYRSYEKLSGTYPNSDDPVLWVEWANERLPVVRYWIVEEKKRISGRRRAYKNVLHLQALQTLERVLNRMCTMSDSWIVIPGKDHILFHPVYAKDYAEPLLFRQAQKVVFASSTIVPKSISMLSVAPSQMDFFEYPSSFPINRRPIYYYPVVKMHYDMEEEENDIWLTVMDRFIGCRLDRKGIIHTVSSARLERLITQSKFASLMVASSTAGVYGHLARTSTPSATPTLSPTGLLARFRAMKPPAILVSPSMGTGIDLPMTQCEYTIVPKVPFPRRNDPMAVARERDDPEWGIFEAAKALVQMTGRAMRSETDSNETLITDSVFGMFLGQYRHYLPKWWLDSVCKIDKLPEPLEKL